MDCNGITTLPVLLIAKGDVSGSVKDNSGAGISGVTVEIHNSFGNLVNNIDGNPLTTTTAADGSYSFTGVPVGDFDVVETDPANYTSVSDGDSSADDDNKTNTDTNNNKIPVTIIKGKSDTGNDFVDKVSASNPFVCSNTFYMSNRSEVGNTSDDSGSTWLHGMNLSNTPFAYSAIGSGYVSSDGGYNALAYNPVDNYLYASVNGGNNERDSNKVNVINTQDWFLEREIFQVKAPSGIFIYTQEEKKK